MLGDLLLSENQYSLPRTVYSSTYMAFLQIGECPDVAMKKTPEALAAFPCSNHRVR